MRTYHAEFQSTQDQETSCTKVIVWLNAEHKCGLPLDFYAKLQDKKSVDISFGSQRLQSSITSESWLIKFDHKDAAGLSHCLVVTYKSGKMQVTTTLDVAHPSLLPRDKVSTVRPSFVDALAPKVQVIDIQHPDEIPQDRVCLIINPHILKAIELSYLRQVLKGQADICVVKTDVLKYRSHTNGMRLSWANRAVVSTPASYHAVTLHLERDSKKVSRFLAFQVLLAACAQGWKHGE